MPWVRLDDGYYSHPKVVAAGLEASGLDVRGWSYCARHDTDGFIAAAVLYVLAPGHRKPEQVAAKLVSVGRWRRDDDADGWWIHDFLDYNPSGAQSREHREELSRKRSEAGRKGAERRWQTDGKPDGNLPMANDGTCLDGKMANGWPRPVPSQLLTSSSEEREGCGQPDDDDLWNLLAKRRLHRQPDVKQPSAWLRRVAVNAKTELAEEARRLHQRYPDLTAAELAANLDGDALPIRHRVTPLRTDTA